MKHLLPRMWVAFTAVLCLAPLTVKADDFDKKTVVTFTQPVEAPGIVLEPGTYVIKLLNSSSNRHIAEIMNEKMDHLYALTFTVAAERLEPTGKPVLTFFEETTSRPKALRKWFWPGEVTGQEFVYPKGQAAKISAATKERVAEGELPSESESGSLTADNAKGLSEEPAAVSQNAVISEQVPEPPAAPAPVIIVQQSAPEPPVAVVAQATPQVTAAQVTESVETPIPISTPTEVAATTPATLPQTASPLPLIGAMGAISLLLAASLAFIRRTRSARGV